MVEYDKVEVGYISIVKVEQEIPEERLKRYLEKLQRLRPIDDSFMRKMFNDNIPLTEFVLRMIIGKDLKVTKVVTQSDLLRLLEARSLSLDVDATDAYGRRIDLEIQRSDHGADVKRARYHLSAMDVENLGKGQDFNELPETYVIFITENDVMGRNKPLYHIERVDAETGVPFNDEEHIIYVNGAYCGEDEIGWLMHDFRCSDPNDMHYIPMRNRAKYYKENQKGVREMCKEMEELREEGREEGKEEGLDTLAALIRKLNETGRSDDIIKVVSDSSYRDKLLKELVIHQE